MPVFTGERIHADDLDFRPDVGQHLAAYHACEAHVPGKLVLDAGCGDARPASLLARSARAVIGVDGSWEVVRDAPRERPANLLLSCGDVRSLSFRDASFDVVCCFQVLEHLENPESLLREAARVLRRGGLFALTTPNRLTSLSENPYHVKEYDPDELRALLEGWFVSVELQGIEGNERVRRLQSSRRRRVRAILRWDPFALRRWLPLSIRKRAFAFLARRVRMGMRSEHRESFDATTECDYSFREDNLAESLDLFALCRNDAPPLHPRRAQVYAE